MNTIEEKIREFARKLTPCGICHRKGCRVEIEDCAWYKDIYKALSEVAKLQEEIDINKACKWFEGYLAEIGYPDDWCRDSEVQESGEKRFRKFMDANTVDDGINEGEALLYTANKVAERTRKEIIEKACKWMCKYCPAQNDKENGLQECEGTEDSCCPALDSLRNFMTSE